MVGIGLHAFSLHAVEGRGPLVDYCSSRLPTFLLPAKEPPYTDHLLAKEGDLFLESFRPCSRFAPLTTQTYARSQLVLYVMGNDKTYDPS